MNETVGTYFINGTSFEWIVDNLNCYNNYAEIRKSSPIIDIRNESETMKWVLTLHKRRAGDGDVLTVSLISKSPINRNISVKCTYTFHSKHSGIVGTKNQTTKNLKFGPNHPINNSNYVIKLQTFFLMIVTCDVELKTNLTKEIRSSESGLSNELHSCFRNKTFSDLIFTVGEKEFHAHKVIVSARSPVFSAMFASDMQENIHNQVNITDAKPDVFCEMLRYIYSGKVNNIERCATDLIVLAEKYDLEYLKIMCENAIIDNVNIESAGDILILADVYSPLRLKPLVLKYIVEHFKEFVDTEKYSNIKDLHPKLLVSVYEMIHKLGKALS